MATKKHYKAITSSPLETGVLTHSWREQRLRVALIYPNSYHSGMSNLGFQTVYQLLNQRDDCLCERFFLPDRHPGQGASSQLLSLESGQPLRAFDLLALSVSFENDYLNLPLIFAAGEIPWLAEQRTEQDPLVLLGGVCAFINPEPLAPVVDVVAVGEAEPLLPGLLAVLSKTALGRQEQLAELAQLPGIYLPGLYQPHYAEDGTVAEVTRSAAAPARVRRQYLADLDLSPSRNFIQTEATEFGDMALTEISRGCSRGCRFCAAGYVYQPPRERGLENLLEQVEQGLCERRRIGLVAAAVADHSAITQLQQGILDRGGQVSVASLRLDALTATEVEQLRESGHKTVAIAPEAGSQRLRDFINKGIDEEQILHAVELLANGGIINLKLYFLIGLPTESVADIDAIITLTGRINDLWREAGRARGRLGSVILSVNPFIPKPFTPLQWAGMAGEKELKKKLRHLQSGIARIHNTRLNHESIRAAVLQAFLSRGDRRVAALLPALAQGMKLKPACQQAGLDSDFYVTRERGEAELFPWEILDQGVRRSYLWQEYQRARQGLLTPPCRPGCRRCGICH